MVLETQPVFRHDGLEIQDVSCRHRRGRGSLEVHRGRHALVFVRRGCFARHVDGDAPSTHDPTLAYCMNPGEQQRYDHPHEQGDDCTAIFFDPALLASVWGGDPQLPRAAVPVSPQLDVEHRALLAAAKSSQDPVTTADRALVLAAALLELADADRVASGAPTTAKRARRWPRPRERRSMSSPSCRSQPSHGCSLSHLTT
jgi:hypothetical protein